MKLSEHTILAGTVQRGHTSSALDKIQFLLQHENLWIGCYKRHFPGLHKLGELMVAAGYYSKKSSPVDIEGSIVKHLEWLRKLRREGKL